MNKLTTLALSTAIGATLVTSASASAQISIGSHKKTEFLFARVFPDATLTHTQANHYDLLVPNKKVGDVAAMAISPHKIAIRLTDKEYTQIAYTGPDGFNKVHPNLFMYIKGHPIIAYTLVGEEQRNGHLVYHLDAIGKTDPDTKAITGEAVMVIDNKELSYGAAIFGGG